MEKPIAIGKDGKKNSVRCIQTWSQFGDLDKKHFVWFVQTVVKYANMKCRVLGTDIQGSCQAS